MTAPSILDQSKIVLTVADLAKRWHCKRQRIYGAISCGELKAFRINYMIRLRLIDVEEFENENKGSPSLPPHESNGYIYFVKADECVKIGFAIDVADRIAELQIANHRSLQLLRTEPGTRSDEARIHAKFAHLRVHGEWFSLSGDLAEHLFAECSYVQSTRTTEHV